MMEAYLKETGIGLKRVRVIAIEDGKSYMEGFRKLISSCGKFDVVYADKEAVIKVIGNKYPVRRIIRKGNISATKIRDAIANDKKWENLTGKSVARLIKKFRGIERIKKAYILDTPKN